LARQSLADLRHPAGQRNVPWPFPLDNWISPKALQDLLRFVESAERTDQEGAMRSSAQRFLREYPEIVKVVPTLLERGDGQAREFAMLLAKTVKTPELLEALKDFALSQHGPDELRHKAAQLVNQTGLLPPGPARLWLQGEWHESHLLAFEVSGEPQQKHKPQVQQWAQEAVQALHQRDARQAKQLLERALASEPDAPDLLQNLSVVYSLEGHDAEAEALVRQIHERHPDYLFARTALAQQCIEHGEFEEARRLLEPLMHRKRLHFSEFDALCGVHVQLHLAEGHRDGARSWLDIWESINPESPTLQTLRLQVDGPRRSLGLLNRSSGGKKRRHHSQVS
jgi:Tfp pilus assembly protein PilF